MSIFEAGEYYVPTYLIYERAMTPENNKDSQESDCRNCQMRMVIGTDLIECMMESMHCQWAMAYGYSRILCKHPSANQFINSN